ncbi:sulfotransferase family 2 domain-containing protein [Palleronia sp. KMU-117]|uniref:sulfotransferase family 2 domain-containing protein n=1 Tax=Palleronia sp. KMU-117 TaxID=3434108 RepID=UPI003D72B39E
MNRITRFELAARAKDAFYSALPLPIAKSLIRISPGSTPFIKEMDDLGVIFVHIPKAAGTTLKKEIYGDTAHYGHRRFVEYLAYDEQRSRRLFTFAVCRNPFERFISTFNYLRNGRITRRDRLFASNFLANFENSSEFAEALEDPVFRFRVMHYDHLRCQTHWTNMPGVSNTHALDLVCRLEDFPQSLSKLEERLGFKIDSSRYERATARDEKASDLTPKARKIIEHVYQSDFRTFGY